MKFVLIVVWFGFPQQQQYPDISSIAWRQPLGVAMREFDDKDACEAQAKRLAWQAESRRNADRSPTTWCRAGANVAA